MPLPNSFKSMAFFSLIAIACVHIFVYAYMFLTILFTLMQMGPKKGDPYCRAVLFNAIVQFWTHKAGVQA